MSSGAQELIESRQQEILGVIRTASEPISAREIWRRYGMWSLGTVQRMLTVLETKQLVTKERRQLNGWAFVWMYRAA